MRGGLSVHSQMENTLCGGLECALLSILLGSECILPILEAVLGGVSQPRCWGLAAGRLGRYGAPAVLTAEGAGQPQ